MQAPAADLQSRLSFALSTAILLLSTLAIMLPVTWVYMSARSGHGHNQSVVQALIVLPMIVAGIVLIVSNSLALAFSLGGVVAAVRFRTNLSDARDVVFIFLAIGVGFAAGVQEVTIAMILSMIFNFVLVLIWRYDFGRPVLEPTAAAEWTEPLNDLAGKDQGGNKVPDRDLVLALTPKKVEALTERFDRVKTLLGPNGKKPRFNAILTIATTDIAEAQKTVEPALDKVTKRWKLDEVVTNTGKPSELYYIVRTRKSVDRDALLTAVRTSGNGAIANADIEIGDALAVEQGRGKAREKEAGTAGMTTASGVAWLSACLLAASGCGTRDLSEVERSPTAVAREQRLEKALDDHNAALAGKPLARWILPAALREISGLALTQDGRLLSQGDEMGEIWELDYRRGILVKHFFLGDKAVKGDFEGIAVAGTTVFMLTSSGKIYQFREGANETHVAYSMVETGLKSAVRVRGYRV